MHINLGIKSDLLHTFIAMADKNKATKKHTKASGSLKQEKEVSVDVKQLLKDDRTYKIIGAVFVLIAILFFVSFTSYLFTWEEDQDKVFKEGYKLLIGSESKLTNLMGSFGAFISHLFIMALELLPIWLALSFLY